MKSCRRVVMSLACVMLVFSMVASEAVPGSVMKYVTIFYSRWYELPQSMTQSLDPLDIGNNCGVIACDVFNTLPQYAREFLIGVRPSLPQPSRIDQCAGYIASMGSGCSDIAIAARNHIQSTVIASWRFVGQEVPHYLATHPLVRDVLIVSGGIALLYGIYRRWCPHAKRRAQHTKACHVPIASDLL